MEMTDITENSGTVPQPWRASDAMYRFLKLTVLELIDVGPITRGNIDISLEKQIVFMPRK